VSEPLDLNALRAVIKNPHRYPLATITEGLEHAINELEDARTTIFLAKQHQKGLARSHRSGGQCWCTTVSADAKGASYEPV